MTLYKDSAANMYEAFSAPLTPVEQECLDVAIDLILDGESIFSVQLLICQTIGIYKGKALVRHACETIEKL